MKGCLTLLAIFIWETDSGAGIDGFIQQCVRGTDCLSCGKARCVSVPSKNQCLLASEEESPRKKREMESWFLAKCIEITGTQLLRALSETVWLQLQYTWILTLSSSHVWEKLFVNREGEASVSDGPVSPCIFHGRRSRLNVYDR